jgi:glycosyltransferase involved in cell wall biosynthesis
MRVAFVDQSVQMGGVEYTTLRLAQALDKSRYDPMIISPEEGGLPSLARQSGLCVVIVPCPKFPSVSLLWKNKYIFNPFGMIVSAINVYRAAHNLELYLKKHPIDVLITKGLMAHFYGGIAAKRLKVPCIWYMQEEVDLNRAWGLHGYLLNRGAKSLPNKIIVDAEDLLGQFSGKFTDKDKLSFINNGIDLKEFKPLSEQEIRSARSVLHIPENSLVVGQAGRIIPLKGQDVLLEAFSQLISKHPNLHLLFVGAPLFGNLEFDKQLKAFVEQQGLSDHVTFTGFLPDVRQGLAAMDIFVQASIETDSPISVLEAMACGLPVVVSGVRGTTEMVKPEVDALIFKPGDPKMLAHSLEQLISSAPLRQDLGKTARLSVISKFSLEQSLVQFQELLEGVYAS